jgi:hypothetical protein
MNVTAVCERSGDWWAVSVPEVEGALGPAAGTATCGQPSRGTPWGSASSIH